MAELDGKSARIYSLGVEILADGGFPNEDNWTGAGDFADPPAGTAVYVDSTNAGTMTQATGEQAVNPVAATLYLFQHTMAVTVDLLPVGDLTITSAMAATAKVLTATVGTHAATFTSAAGVASASFVLDVAASTAGTFTIDDVSMRAATNIPFVTATPDDGRQLTDVPPDNNTTGMKVIDPDIYQMTLSIQGNFDEALTTNAIETAYNAGALGNSVTLAIVTNTLTETHWKIATFVVEKFNITTDVGTTQPWTAELKSTGDIIRINS